MQVAALCRSAFGPDGPTITGLTDANRGRGAFSVVLRAELAWPGSTAAGPSSVVAKLPVGGANGRSAIESGAYDREALAYGSLLPGSPITTPTIFAIDQPGDGTCSLLMEDLSSHRSYDQVTGLPGEAALAVARQLTHFHRAWADDPRLAGLPVRRNTVAGLPGDGLAAGLACLETSWSDVLGPDERDLYRRLVDARPRLAERFAAAPTTLCHGDPRADNFVFDRNGRLVLFDWQQLAVQFGEADLAWLSATSLEVDGRRRLDDDLVNAYGGSRDRYRLGMALPGLAVLLLAQRELGGERTRRFVAVSLKRIAAAVGDLDVPGLA